MTVSRRGVWAYYAANPNGLAVVRTALGALAPERNLAIQSAVIGRARAFVGTYGGYAYLAPFYGVPALAFHSVRSFKLHHLHAAQRVFDGLGAATVIILLTMVSRAAASPMLQRLWGVSVQCRRTGSITLMARRRSRRRCPGRARPHSPGLRPPRPLPPPGSRTPPSEGTRPRFSTATRPIQGRAWDHWSRAPKWSPARRVSPRGPRTGRRLPAR